MDDHAMRRAREVVEAFARQAAGHATAETQRVEIECEWYDIGGRKGPTLRFLAPGNRELPMPVAFGDYIELADSFTEALQENDQAPLRLQLRTASGVVPNFLRASMDLGGGGAVTVDWCHDPGVDERHHAGLRESMGAEAYEEALATHQRRGGPAGTPAAAPQPDSSAPAPSAPDLFRAIVQAVQEQAPAGWQQLVIDGEVWREPDAQGRPHTHIHADFRVRLADGSLKLVRPANAIGPMNALEALQGCWLKDDGSAWRRIRITYDAGASSVDLDYDLPASPDTAT